jgi:hypothetical protein
VYVCAGLLGCASRTDIFILSNAVAFSATPKKSGNAEGGRTRLGVRRHTNDLMASCACHKACRHCAGIDLYGKKAKP